MIPNYTEPPKPQPQLVIEMPKKVNPWLNLWANPRFAPFSANATLSAVTASGTAQNQIAYSFPVMTDYSFVEQVENFRELEFGKNKPQIYVETETPKRLPNQPNYLATFGETNKNEL